MAQLASASALGAEGPPFESEYPDTKNQVFAATQILVSFIDGTQTEHRIFVTGSQDVSHPYRYQVG